MDSPDQPSAPTHSRRAVLRSGVTAAGGLLLAACIPGDGKGRDRRRRGHQRHDRWR